MFSTDALQASYCSPPPLPDRFYIFMCHKSTLQMQYREYENILNEFH